METQNSSRYRRAGLVLAFLTTVLSAGCSQPESDPVPSVQVVGNLVTVAGLGDAPDSVTFDGRTTPIVGTSAAGWTASVSLPQGEHSVRVTRGEESRELSARVDMAQPRAQRASYAKTVLKRERDPHPLHPSETARDVIDVPATIARLRELHVNEFQYLIYNWRPRVHDGTDELIRSDQRWQQLPEFAAAAERAGIAVRVYLVPPPESAESPYLPFKWDYARWFLEIAELSRTHPAIKGIVMDDMRTWQQPNDPKKPSASPAEVASWLAQARRVAPDLTFTALFYALDTNSGDRAVLPEWRGTIDGVEFAYSGRGNRQGLGGNTTDWQRTEQITESAIFATNCARSDVPCTLVDLPVGAKPDAVARLTSSVEIPSGGPLQVWISAGVLPTAKQDQAKIELLVDGKPVGHARIATRRGRYDFHLPAELAGRRQVTVQLTRPGGARHFWMVNAPVVNNDAATATQLDVQRGATAVAVRPIPFTGMVYCFRLYSERNNPDAASPQYVQSVLDTFDGFRQRGLMVGAVAYQPNIDGRVQGRRFGGKPEVTTVVGQEFGTWR